MCAMMMVIVADCGVDARFECRDVMNREVTRDASRLNIGFRRGIREEELGEGVFVP